MTAVDYRGQTTIITGASSGIGVEFDEAAAARFPYEPRYLPVNRRLDGSMHDW